MPKNNSEETEELTHGPEEDDEAQEQETHTVEQRQDKENEKPPAEDLVDLEDLIEADEETLFEQLEKAREVADEYLEGWQRARAEFSNYKKRMEREQSGMRSRIGGDILLRVLAVVDDLERALKDKPTKGDAGAWAEGIDLIYKKMQMILESEGVKEIEAEGDLFNPQLHEAISHEDSEEHESGEVIDVVQKGYVIADRVLRPAMVRVAK